MNDLAKLEKFFITNIELLIANDVRYFFALNLNAELGTRLTRKQIKEVYDIVKADVGVDFSRRIHNNLSGVEVKNNAYAIHLEDKILERQDAEMI